jgi:hypothetical protein
MAPMSKSTSGNVGLPTRLRPLPSPRSHPTLMVFRRADDSDGMAHREGTRVETLEEE